MTSTLCEFHFSIYSSVSSMIAQKTWNNDKERSQSLSCLTTKYDCCQQSFLEEAAWPALTWPARNYCNCCCQVPKSIDLSWGWLNGRVKPVLCAQLLFLDAVLAEDKACGQALGKRQHNFTRLFSVWVSSTLTNTNSKAG